MEPVAGELFGQFGSGPLLRLLLNFQILQQNQFSSEHSRLSKSKRQQENNENTEFH